MKKSLLILLAAATICGCQREQLVERVRSYGPEFKAEICSDYETKTALDGQKVVWSLHDSVTIFRGSTKPLSYAVKGGTEGKTVCTLERIDSFTAISESGNKKSYSTIGQNVAFFPLNNEVELSNTGAGTYEINTTLPTTQTAVKNSFGKTSFPMVAVTANTEETDLAFRNVLGLLKLSFADSPIPIQRIILKGNSSEKLSGAARITCSSTGVPSIEMLGSAADSVVIEVPTDTTAASYYVALPPVSFASGLTVTVDFGVTKVVKSTSERIDIVRSASTSMAEISFDELKIPVTSVTLDKHEVSLFVGYTSTLTASVQPDKATNKNVTWSSSDETVATVIDGKVTAVKTGSTTITAKASRGEEMDTCTIDVIEDCFCITALEDGVTVSLMKEGTVTSSYVYSTDKINWPAVTLDAPFAMLERAGDKVYVRAAVARKETQSLENYIYFAVDKKYEVSGNIMYLVNPRGTLSSVYRPNEFSCLFEYCSSLIKSDKLVLPADTVGYNCYSYMFYRCRSLTTAPSSLPATTLAESCYSNMFYGCTSLTTAPSSLPATTLAESCYSNMFSGCRSLTTAPSSLPATTLAESCYSNMFDGCTSLTTAPELPATTLAESCYSNMFVGCTSLTTAPELPATNLSNYCYRNMFSGCTSLTTAPSSLPATTLAESCYSTMFLGCTSLTTAPELPATNLSNYCYSSMFSGCTNLSSVCCLATQNFYGTSFWLYGVSSTGTFTKAPGMTTWTTGSDGIPLGWTVVDYTE